MIHHFYPDGDDSPFARKTQQVASDVVVKMTDSDCLTAMNANMDDVLNYSVII